MSAWRGVGLALSVHVLVGCPPPVAPIEDPDAFELEVPPQPLQGVVQGDPWNVVQSFAFDRGDQSYELYLAPEPVTACDAASGGVDGVLSVDVYELGLMPWGEDTAINTLNLPDDASLSTLGGGIEIDLDPSGQNLVGGMVFDFDEDTKLEGEFTVPLCATTRR